MTQGDYIKSLLRGKKIKHSYIAEKMGISTSTFSNKLNGYRIFKEPEIKILLKILGMSYEEVFNTNSITIVANDKKTVYINGEKFVISNKLASEIISIIQEKEVV
jgi:transcriptional regulator with XRE-family HTH domain